MHYHSVLLFIANGIDDDSACVSRILDAIFVQAGILDTRYAFARRFGHRGEIQEALADDNNSRLLSYRKEFNLYESTVISRYIDGLECLGTS